MELVGYFGTEKKKPNVKKGAKKMAKDIFYGTGYVYADMAGYKYKSKKKARTLTEMI